MRETVITAAHKKRELYILAVCTLAAIVMNIIGIVKFNTPATELITQLPWVLLLALLLYVIQALLRFIFYLVFKSWKKQ